MSNALFISVLLKRIAASQTLHRHTKYRDDIIRLEDMSDKFEEIAIGVRQQLRHDFCTISHVLLSSMPLRTRRVTCST